MKTEVKKYSIEIIESDKGYSMNRTVEGFTALELMGVLEFIQLEIIEQMKGAIKPTEINRTVIINK
jgi:hypothetical protein